MRSAWLRGLDWTRGGWSADPGRVPGHVTCCRLRFADVRRQLVASLAVIWEELLLLFMRANCLGQAIKNGGSRCGGAHVTGLANGQSAAVYMRASRASLS